MNTWQTIITASGDDLSFESSGFDSPRNWFRFRGIPILEWSILSHSSVSDANVFLTLKSEEEAHWNASHLESRGLKAIFVQNSTQGALCSALLATDYLIQGAPLIVAPGDSYITPSISSYFQEFQESGARAGTIVFKSESDRFSYVRKSPTGVIFEVTEKKALSPWATTGVFFFKSSEDFLRAAEWVIASNSRHAGKFFLSTTLNYFLMKGDLVTSMELMSGHQYIRLTTPADIVRELNKIEEI